MIAIVIRVFLMLVLILIYLFSVLISNYHVEYN